MKKQTKQTKLTKKQMRERLDELTNDPDATEYYEEFQSDESVLREELLNDEEFDYNEWMEVWAEWFNQLD